MPRHHTAHGTTGYSWRDCERSGTGTGTVGLPGEPGLADVLESDRDALRASAMLWRLKDVSQTTRPHEPGRNRLTHSFSVARTARRIAAGLGGSPAMVAVVDAAALAHDVGHPPFGHNGERALAAAAQDCGGFEANAQTLRLLIRTPPVHPRLPGMTRAVLDATCKYPRPRRDGIRKFGVYSDDLAAFTWMRADVSGERLCFEAQIMDWADDLANAVDDLADAITVAAIPGHALTDRDERVLIATLAYEHFTDHAFVNADQLAHVTENLARHPLAEALAHGSCSPWAAARHARATGAEIAADLIRATVDATVAGHDETAPLTRHRADLVVPGEAQALVAVLKALTLRHVLRAPAPRARRTLQAELLAELVALLGERAPAQLPAPAAHAWHTATSEADQARVVIDHVAALTDSAAIALHSALTGRDRA